MSADGCGVLFVCGHFTNARVRPGRARPLPVRGLRRLPYAGILRRIEHLASASGARREVSGKAHSVLPACGRAVPGRSPFADYIGKSGSARPQSVRGPGRRAGFRPPPAFVHVSQSEIRNRKNFLQD